MKYKVWCFLERERNVWLFAAPNGAAPKEVMLMLALVFQQDGKCTFEHLKCQQATRVAQKIQQVGEKVKHVADFSAMHTLLQLYRTLFIIHIIKFRRECDLVGCALPGSVYNLRSGALFNPKKIQREWKSCCCFSLQEPGKSVWLIIHTQSPLLRDLQSDKLAVTWALSHYQSPAR